MTEQWHINYSFICSLIKQKLWPTSIKTGFTETMMIYIWQPINYGDFLMITTMVKKMMITVQLKAIISTHCFIYIAGRFKMFDTRNYNNKPKSLNKI